MIDIRHENDGDLPELLEIHRDAFQRSDEADLVEQLHRNPQYNREYSFVALIDGKAVGHLLFTPLNIRYSSSSTMISSLALAPISVRRDFQRKQIGTQLIQCALNELKSKDVASIVVLGHEHFYPRFGFRPAREFHIRGPFQLENDDCLMILPLKENPFPLDQGEGLLQYLAEFGL